jgi:2-polyprenyl-3-methyl-5-hydroxy-6-metoxy-1,4-benzoquinol methylase
MLQFLSKDRTITGVDYDEDKIDVAQHGYLRTEQLHFHCADVMLFPMEKYDIIIISDVLHYLNFDGQETLLTRSFNALNPGGKVIVREGNAELAKRHRGTQVTEFFSVKLLKFNKATQALNFVSGETLRTIANKHGLEVSIQDDTKYTSNVIFVISSLFFVINFITE